MWSTCSKENTLTQKTVFLKKAQFGCIFPRDSFSWGCITWELFVLFQQETYTARQQLLWIDMPWYLRCLHVIKQVPCYFLLFLFPFFSTCCPWSNVSAFFWPALLDNETNLFFLPFFSYFNTALPTSIWLHQSNSNWLLQYLCVEISHAAACVNICRVIGKVWNWRNLGEEWPRIKNHK